MSNPIDTRLIKNPSARPRTIENINATSPLPLSLCVLIITIQDYYLLTTPASGGNLFYELKCFLPV